MKKEELTELLQRVAHQQVTIKGALAQINDQGFLDLNYAKVDTNRLQRTGAPEVVYGEGKTAEQIIGIVQAMLVQKDNIMVTRVTAEKATLVRQAIPQLKYVAVAKMLLYKMHSVQPVSGKIAVVTAGTSDQKIAEEAAVTAEMYGNQVIRVYDVGVAGIHRLFAKLEIIRAAQVVIVVAGMEGALASVVGGLVSSPIIAVPTSVGYGTAFNGVTALLTMLNSCSTGITVVNIDNGFGAGYSASKINHLQEESNENSLS
ncbi:MAG: nickel pincer cofactor biosynthesis protein LarB [Liquorilactobacillus ghanensis]|uniref:nickel pincer cofactor biosynthesis protein LarB n=1 Tax=Liquorilactobacillus ghanensis TaxID=399370 RepID=UPI0039EA4060